MVEGATSSSRRDCGYMGRRGLGVCRDLPRSHCPRSEVFLPDLEAGVRGLMRPEVGQSRLANEPGPCRRRQVVYAWVHDLLGTTRHATLIANVPTYRTRTRRTTVVIDKSATCGATANESGGYGIGRQPCHRASAAAIERAKPIRQLVRQSPVRVEPWPNAGAQKRARSRARHVDLRPSCSRVSSYVTPAG